MKKQVKKLSAIQASQHFKVAPHAHSGHLLPKRSTSYPLLAMILLCVGVFLASWTSYVGAWPPPVTNSYVVHASVPGPPPSVPATIDSPVSGTIFTSLPITVSGSCPVGTYETLYRNSVFSGVALCSALGDYSLQTGLFSGNNVLQVRDFSTTDVPGPLSSSVTVVYAPTPPPVVNNPGSGSTSSGQTTIPTPISPPPLILKTNFVYQGYYSGQPTTWTLEIEGGVAPYAISINWGDGKTDLVSRPASGLLALSHTYQKAGGYRGSLVTNFSASDSVGNQTFLQLLAIINNPPTAASTTSQSGSGLGNFLSSTPHFLSNMIRYVWPSYALVVLLLLSFWLGERREYHLLRPLLRKARRAN